MNFLRLKPSTIACALILSQGLGAAILCVPRAQSKAEAFNFGKKKNADSDATDQNNKNSGDKGKANLEESTGKSKGKGKSANDGKAKSDDDEKASSEEDGSDAKTKLKGKASKEEEPPKEKHMSKAEIQEEEQLEAEYAEYQKQLKDLLKQVKTPFGSNDPKTEKSEESELSPMTLAGSSSGHTGHLNLGSRVLQKCKVYMPGHMVIGRQAEFTVQGRPGSWAALAMADRDTGAKPIYGQNIRLGPDRKVVALGKIPASGVLVLKIFAPVAGDLVGGKLYFEAAVWPENQPERLELALPVSSETQQASTANSVALTGQGERKHGIKFVPDARSPYSRINGPGLGSGSPI